MRHGLPLLIVLAAASAMTACASRASEAISVPRQTSTSTFNTSTSTITSLPTTPVVTLEQVPTDLTTFIHGRAAVISFWATWCDTCAGETDSLQRLQVQAAGRSDALVVGVAVGEAPDTVAAFARERGLRYAQLVDPDYQLADALGQRSVPATLVVDRGGRIVYRGGALDAAGLAAFRNALNAR
jgi:peroxiredoxin